jgi:hypothetical protein
MDGWSLIARGAATDSCVTSRNKEQLLSLATLMMTSTRKRFDQFGDRLKSNPHD